MEIMVKAKFNASKQRIESFGNNKYLVYLPFPEDFSSLVLISAMFSKHLGVPQNRIQFKNRNFSKDYIFQIL